MNQKDKAVWGWIKIWDNIELTLVTIFLAVAWALSVMEVFTRYVLHFAYYWTLEFILYFMIWSTFLGASHVLKRGEHIRLNILIGRLSPTKQKYLDLITNVIGLGFSVMLAISGFHLVYDAYVTGETSSSLARVPMWIPYSIMPLAGILLVLRFLERFPRIWQGGEK